VHTVSDRAYGHSITEQDAAQDARNICLGSRSQIRIRWSSAQQTRLRQRRSLQVRGAYSGGLCLNLTNALNNFRRLGFSDDDVAKPGSDRLVDAVVAHGTVDEIATRLKPHLDAGADHVPVQVLTSPEKLVPALTELAGPLGLQLRPMIYLGRRFSPGSPGLDVGRDRFGQLRCRNPVNPRGDHYTDLRGSQNIRFGFAVMDALGHPA
jgi:hypothetical protein